MKPSRPHQSASRIQIALAAVMLGLATVAVFFAIKQTVRARQAAELAASGDTSISIRPTGPSSAARVQTVEPTISATIAEEISAPKPPPATSSPDSSADLQGRAQEALQRQRYGRFFRDRAWSDPQIAAFVELLTAQRLKRTGPEQSRAEMAALLSPPDLAAFDRHQMTIPHWRTVTETAAQLYTTDAPLSASQADQLAELLMTHVPPTKGRASLHLADRPGFIAGAAAFLTPDQLTVLGTLLERQALRREINRLRHEQRTAADPPDPES